MKKKILILSGVVLVLGTVGFLLYRRQQKKSGSTEVIDTEDAGGGSGQSGNVSNQSSGTNNTSGSSTNSIELKPQRTAFNMGSMSNLNCINFNRSFASFKNKFVRYKGIVYWCNGTGILVHWVLKTGGGQDNANAVWSASTELSDAQASKFVVMTDAHFVSLKANPLAFKMSTDASKYKPLSAGMAESSRVETAKCGLPYQFT